MFGKVFAFGLSAAAGLDDLHPRMARAICSKAMEPSKERVG
jgi:hypothetical protein